MAEHRKIEEDVPDLLVKYHEAVTTAFRKAVKDALLRHKRNGNSIAVARNGKVVVLRPEEISVS